MTDAFGPFEVRPINRHFTGRLGYTRRVGLQFNDLHYVGQGIERTRGNASLLDEEFYTFGVSLSGPLVVERHGRGFRVDPGSLYLMNQSLPYRAVPEDEAGFHSLSISIPSSALRLHSRHLEPFYKLELADGSPRGALLRGYFGHVHGGLDFWSDAELRKVCQHLIDLIDLFLIQGEPIHDAVSDSSVVTAHLHRILAYINLHLSDPDLDPQSVARVCQISTSYLHRILQTSNLSAEKYIYDRRLEKARELLLDSRQLHLSIAEVCYRCGFKQPTHFSRIFRARFGQTPCSFRKSLSEVRPKQ
jgi:AraC-like DNA-binding protein